MKKVALVFEQCFGCYSLNSRANKGGSGRLTGTESAGKFVEDFIEFLHENCETDMRNYILTFSKIHTIIRSLAFTIRMFGPVFLMVFDIVGSGFNNLFLFMQPLHADPRRGDARNFNLQEVGVQVNCRAQGFAGGVPAVTRSSRA